MKRDLMLYYQDILDSINLIGQYIGTRNYWKFKKDRKVVDAVIWRIEVIGEAIRMIPRRIRDSVVEVPWEDYVQSRNFLIHVYFGVNELRLWNMVKKDVPVLKLAIEKIMEKFNNGRED